MKSPITSSVALALVLLFATAAKAETVTLKGDAVISALNSGIKTMKMTAGAHSESAASDDNLKMINTQLQMSGKKTRAVCVQRENEDAQDCKIMMIIPGEAKGKPWMAIYKFSMAQGKVTSDLTYETQTQK